MAIFQSQYERKVPLDDTIAISAIIENCKEVNGHTEYLLRVQRGPFKDNCWIIYRRYNDFAQLHKCLSISGIELPMPGKRIFGNMRPEFVAERRKALQVFLNAVLMNPILASSLPAKRFVDPESYAQSSHDHAVQNALLCLRSDSIWTLGPTLGAIGWRVRKHFFKVTTKPPEKSSNKLLVKSGSQSHQSKHFSSGSSNGSGGSIDIATIDLNAEMVLEWLEYGPDKYVDDKEINGILKSLIGLHHPHIEALAYAANTESGCVVIRKFYKHGTLKDMLCMSTPKNPFLSKYGNPKGRTALSMRQVATYGKQILEALIFLHSKGYAFGHLHSGNIVIVNDCVKLLDIENHLLGVPAFYRPFFVQHSKLHSAETVDVYCFGHVIFEMAMGYPMQESVARQISDCPEALKHLLEIILTKEACKVGLPTLEQLLEHRFFTQYADTSHDTVAASTSADDGNKPHFKLSLNAKEALKQAAIKAEHRLREEQKSVKNQKRIVRVQELMSCEEEKRKSKQKARHEHKQSKLKQQGSIQTNNGRLSLSAASSTAAGALTSASFNRSDSVLSPEDATHIGIKSPPSTPAPLHNTQTHVHGAQQQFIDDAIQHAVASGSGSVERQSSSPNISSDDHSEHGGRSALLESICKFNRGSLRKVRSND